MGSTRLGQYQMPEPEKARLNERMCLRAKKGSGEKRCLIRSKFALTLLTRLVFLVLTLSCAAVITTSIWLMMNCRESFSTVRPMMPEHALFCTNMGMPALFACCTILFTVFGLGCTGRRLTGYALIIISSVEILQSVTTLAFYKCNTISHHDILDTVNSSLLACQRPVGFNHPIFMTAETITITSGAPANGLREAKRGSHTVGQVDQVHPLEKGGFGWSQQGGIQAGTSQSNDTLRLALKRHIDQFNNKMRVTSHSDPERKTIKPFNPDRSRHFDIAKGDVQCVMSSPFFTHLSLKLRQNEVHECLEVCLTYLAVCFNPVRVELVKGGAASTTPRFQHKQDSAVSPQPPYNIRPTSRNRQTFEEDVFECGHLVLQHVNNLCFYNDEVILPLSICAPVFYIFLSLCFIYLCHCDRRLKESPPPEIVTPKVPGHTANIPSQWSWRRLPFFSGQDYGAASCKCGVGGKRTSGLAIPGLGHTTHGTFSSVTLNSECSSSTHELLQMKTLPLAEISNTLSLSHGASHDTLDTLLSDDQNPSVKP